MNIYYLIEGRIITERTGITLPNINCKPVLNETELNKTISSILSKLFVYVSSNSEFDPYDLRNFLFDVIGIIIGRISFWHHFGLSFELDSVSDISKNETVVYGVEGYAFQDNLLDVVTFRSHRDGQKFELSFAHLENNALSRVTFELKNVIRNLSYTALHCRLSIEAVRNHFDSRNEPLG